MRSKEEWEDGQQLVEAQHLLKDAHRVEFKLTVRDTDRASAIDALDLDVLKAELRQVVFFDTPDLKLDKAGIVLRARRIRKCGDSTIKLRPVAVEALPRKLRQSSRFSIEVDAMPTAVVCSGSLTDLVDNGAVKEVLDGKRPIRKLFGSKQRSFYRDHAPLGLDLDTLVPFGPINIARMKFIPRELRGRAASAELWFYPDGSRLLEISTKCEPHEAFHVLADARALLERHGISRQGTQETKTRKTLDYFSRLYARAS